MTADQQRLPVHLNKTAILQKRERAQTKSSTTKLSTSQNNAKWRGTDVSKSTSRLMCGTKTTENKRFSRQKHKRHYKSSPTTSLSYIPHLSKGPSVQARPLGQRARGPRASWSPCPLAERGAGPRFRPSYTATQVFPARAMRMPDPVSPRRGPISSTTETCVSGHSVTLIPSARRELSFKWTASAAPRRERGEKRKRRVNITQFGS